ncbi:hypothetical protein PP707_07850, partial [Acetobacter pasteurianus]|nr:hypothetical protein [Acetobacter pasteurianus]
TVMFFYIIQLIARSAADYRSIIYKTNLFRSLSLVFERKKTSFNNLVEDSIKKKERMERCSIIRG